MDIEIVVLSLHEGKKKNGDRWYSLDYYRTDTFRASTSFFENALEYETVKKKLGDKHVVKCIGHRLPNQYDQLYIADITIK